MTHDSFACHATGALLARVGRAALTLAGVGLLSAAFGGCGNDFEARSRLSQLRLLALQASPVNPAEGTSTTVTPLVYTPSAAPLTFRWSWCPLLGQADDGWSCPVTHDEAQAMLGAAGLASALPSFDLGTGTTATFTNVFPATLLADLCRVGLDAQKLDCRQGGFPVRLSVEVSQADAMGTAVQQGTTILRLPTEAGAVSNANPALGGLSVELAGAVVPLDEGATVVLPRAKESKLHLTVDDGAAETYVATDASGATTSERETLLFSWFAELGDLNDERTLFIDGATTLADQAADKWKTPATREDTRATSRVIVVARDDRGGVSWTSAAASLEVTP